MFSVSTDFFVLSISYSRFARAMSLSNTGKINVGNAIVKGRISCSVGNDINDILYRVGAIVMVCSSRAIYCLRL